METKMQRYASANHFVEKYVPTNTQVEDYLTKN